VLYSLLLAPNVKCLPKTVFHDPRYGCSLHFVLLLLWKEASRKQHDLKIAAVGSGTLFYSALTMERLFSPCTRLHDILENQGRLEQLRAYYPELFQELSECIYRRASQLGKGVYIR
jgi:hypothetical protein